MSALNDIKENNSWVYFLKMEQGLPVYYIQLARKFKNFGIDLIPVDSKQLTSFMRREEAATILVVTSSFNERRLFERKHQNTIKLLLQHGGLSVFHLSSFMQRYDKYNGRSKRNYYFLSLPISFNLIGSIVQKKILSQSSGSESLWPGGRGATLSKEVSRN